MAPFLIEALLLLLLSVPKDNLLLQLVDALAAPTSTWIPAILLTLISTYVYIKTIGLQVSKAYLLPERDLWRTGLTSLVYFIICFGLGLFVLTFELEKSNTTRNIPTFGDLWTCSLIALLSLIGIGWQGPTSWVEDLGVKVPDYTKGRIAARKLSEILKNERKDHVAEAKDLQEFFSEARKLCASIKENIELEPVFMKSKMTSIMDNLSIIINKVDETFIKQPDGVQRFTNFCKVNDATIYPELTEAVRSLSSYWPDWVSNNWG